MSVSQSRMASSRMEGNLCESRFAAIFPGIKPSTKEENIFKHIDFFLPDGTSVDVKGKNKPDEIWVEILNVKGNKGWLYGEADIIAFELVEVGGFVMVNTDELRVFVAKHVQKEFTSKHESYRKLYRRKGRLDIITKLYITDIMSLPSTTVVHFSRTFSDKEDGSLINF
jgi:hypothetical protein